MTSLNNIISEFQIFYQKISDFDKSDLTPVEKWQKISSYIHENNEFVVKIFAILKKDDERKQVDLDYKMDHSQLEKQISQESNPVVKSSLIIVGLHNIIYKLLSTEGNYFFSLDGREEMKVLKKKIIYYVNLSAKNEQNIFFHAYILLYALESLFNTHFYIGVDFEYTNKKIQLAQLNFEHNVTLQGIIMMVSPNELEPVMMENFINLIICNKYIKKILHGSDSLDIPYMYNHMLQNDPNKIIRFTRTLIDTRFLCEYYKLTRSDPSDNRCSIYDEDPARSAIYYFNVISEEQQNKLTELLQSMPAPHDIQWNIKKMPLSQSIYASRDVLYLKFAMMKIIEVATKDEDTDLGKKSVIELYKHVLNEITQFVYLERNNITFLMTKCKEEVDVVNNYFIRKPNGILKMIDVFTQVSTGLETTDPKVNIDKLTKVNHFKVPVMTIIKRLVYGYISQKCRVQKDKSTTWTDKLSNQFIFDFLEKMNFYHLLKMFKELDKTLEAKVRTICSS